MADHLVLETEGLAFAPHPMLVETDRDKYCVQQIVDFYQRQPTDLADYFQAAWRFKHRAALGQPRATLADAGRRRARSARSTSPPSGARWRSRREEVGPAGAAAERCGASCPPRAASGRRRWRAPARGMRDFVVALRKKLEPRFAELAVAGHRGHRAAAADVAEPAVRQPPHELRPRRCRSRASVRRGRRPQACRQTPRRRGRRARGRARAPAADPDLSCPPPSARRYEAAFARFCAVFPDTFYVSERGRNYLRQRPRDKGRLLSAGFHNLMGYFRDDQPLYQLVLDEQQQKELDRAVARAGLRRRRPPAAPTCSSTSTSAGRSRTHRQRRPSRMRPGPRSGTASSPSRRSGSWRSVYLARPRGEARSDVASRRSTTTSSESTPPSAGSSGARRRPSRGTCRRCWTFAERGLPPAARPGRARRPAGLLPLAPRRSGLGHEEAMRDVLVSVLMSPDFCYRIDLVAEGGHGARPLSGPRAGQPPQLLPVVQHARRRAAGPRRGGRPAPPEVLAAQARRMLKDPRARGLATEFGGNWLDFRRFEEHNAVDRERFPTFTTSCGRPCSRSPSGSCWTCSARTARCWTSSTRKHTFVNPVLAKHYGMPVPVGAAANWATAGGGRGREQVWAAPASSPWRCS